MSDAMAVIAIWIALLVGFVLGAAWRDRRLGDD